MAAIPMLEAREAARAGLLGQAEMSAEALWGFMADAGVGLLELRKFFATRGTKLIEKGYKPDYPPQYAAVIREAKAAPAPKHSAPKSAAEWLDYVEAQ